MMRWLKVWRKQHARRRAPSRAGYEVEACALTDVGCLRENNEDSIRYHPPGTSSGLPGPLLIVADGMGGHAGGDVASRMAVDTVSHYVDRRRRKNLHAVLREALHAANRAIYKEASREKDLKGMGTTCTALLVRDGLAYCAHVGDSRLYLIRDGRIYLMSEDHSLVRELVRQGLLSRSEARCHDDKNVILRALGLRSHVDVMTWPEPLSVRAEDRLLLCSDGLYDLLEDDEIRDVVLTLPTREACRHLIELARKRGGYDNISVGLIRLKRAGEPGSRKPIPTTRVAAVL